MTHLLRTVSLSALVLGLSAATGLAEEKTAWRLFVADRDAPMVHVIDAVTGKQMESFTTRSPARIYPTSSGRSVFAVQADANTVQAISTGISFDDHGDHGDIEIEKPALIDAAIDGMKPVHFVEHHGDIALFFDGDGVAKIMSEKAMLEGKPVIRDVTTVAPHHGVAVPLGDYVLVTEPDRNDPSKLPIGINVLDKSGKKLGGLHECPDLHGEASSGNMLLIACAEGLLAIETGGGAPEVRLLSYGATLPEGKTTTLIGGKGLQYFLGNYGADRVVLIDPAEEDAFRLVQLPTRRVHFAVDPIRSKFAYIFTEDGNLHQLDVLAGTLTKSIRLTESYTMDGHWNDPRPRIAVAGDSIVVTDPLQERLHLVDPVSFEKKGEIAVEGRPYNIVAVGGSGEAH